ncbi:hypothetical protein [Anaplasma marginale]|uniref:Uncharacterized protein n=2 Tax=Anaplasma marginale TaxID=770 RepID=B9KHM5_ANAMF|nr:hypothetical protein [Anaplasma marginale]ACM48987.1 Hypothetical protein AMF_099 [Anaplasma marginale str. Florida]
MNRQAFLTELRNARDSLDLKTIEHAARMSSYVAETLSNSELTDLRKQCAETFTEIRINLVTTNNTPALNSYNKYVKDVLARALSALYATIALHRNKQYSTPYKSISRILASGVPNAEKYMLLLMEFTEALRPTRVKCFPESHTGTSVGRVRTTIMQNVTQLYVHGAEHDQYVGRLHECLLKILDKTPFLLATCERITLARALLARISDILNVDEPSRQGSAHEESLQLQYLDFVTKTALSLRHRSKIAASCGAQEPEMSPLYVAKLFEIICSTTISSLMRHRTEYPGLRATSEQLVCLGRDIAASGFLNAEQLAVFSEVHLPLVEHLRGLCKQMDKYTRYASQGWYREAAQKWHKEIVPLLRGVSVLAHAAQVPEENDTQGGDKIFQKVRLKPICQLNILPTNSHDIARYKYHRRCIDRFYSGLLHLMCNVHFLDSVMIQLDEKISRMCRDSGTRYAALDSDTLTTSIHRYLGTLQGATHTAAGEVTNSHTLIETAAALLSHALVMIDGHHMSRTPGSSAYEQHNHMQSTIRSSVIESEHKFRHLAELKRHMASCALMAPPRQQSAYVGASCISMQSHLPGTSSSTYITQASHLPSATERKHTSSMLPSVQGIAVPQVQQNVATQHANAAQYGAGPESRAGGSVTGNAHGFQNMQAHATTYVAGYVPSQHAVQTASGTRGQSGAISYHGNTGFSGSETFVGNPTQLQAAHTNYSAAYTGSTHPGQQRNIDLVAHPVTQPAVNPCWWAGSNTGHAVHTQTTSRPIIAPELAAHTRAEVTQGLSAVEVATYGPVPVGITTQSATPHPQFGDAPDSALLEVHYVNQATHNDTSFGVETSSPGATTQRMYARNGRLGERHSWAPYQITCRRGSEASYPNPGPSTTLTFAAPPRSITAQTAHGYAFVRPDGYEDNSAALRVNDCTRGTLTSASCQDQPMAAYAEYTSSDSTQSDTDSSHSPILVIDEVTPAITQGHTKIA